MREARRRKVLGCFKQKKPSNPAREARRGNQGFLTKNFPSGGDYDVPAETAVWFFQYLGTDFSAMVNAVTGEIIPPIIPGVALKNEQKLIPQNYSLSQNYPNPFNPETIIDFGLPKNSKVEICIFNLQGQKIVTLTKSFQNAGYHKIKWDGNDENGFPVSSGVYLYQLKAGNSIAVKKMALLR